MPDDDKILRELFVCLLIYLVNAELTLSSSSFNLVSFVIVVKPSYFGSSIMSVPLILLFLVLFSLFGSLISNAVSFSGLYLRLFGPVRENFFIQID